MKGTDYQRLYIIQKTGVVFICILLYNYKINFSLAKHNNMNDNKNNLSTTEEFLQLLRDKRVQRIVAPELIYALITVAEDGNEKQLQEAITLIKGKNDVLNAIDNKFETVMNDIVKDFEVGIVSVKMEERKSKMNEYREQERMEEKNLEEVLNKSLKNI